MKQTNVYLSGLSAHFFQRMKSAVLLFILTLLIPNAVAIVKSLLIPDTILTGSYVQTVQNSVINVAKDVGGNSVTFMYVSGRVFSLIIL